MTDGTAEANAEFRRGVGFYYDLVKANVGRIVTGLAAELADHPVAAVGVTPGWLRSEAMLDTFGVTEETWRDACHTGPGVRDLRVADVRRAGRRRPRRRDADAQPLGRRRSPAPASSPTRTASPTPTAARPDCWGHLARFGWGHGERSRHRRDGGAP